MMWLVMKAYSWESMKLETTLPYFTKLQIPDDFPERFMPVFNDYEKAKKWADESEAEVVQIQEVSP